jgi:integrase/recombinase XerC
MVHDQASSRHLQPIELDCADETLTLEMTRWLSHLRAERRLSPKTLEPIAATSPVPGFSRRALGRRGHAGRALPRLEASDVRAFMAMRRADDIGGAR